MGKTYNLPITCDNLMYWTLDMYKRGYEFDCRFDAYGAPFDKNNQEFPDFSKNKENEYFEEAVSCYNSQNLSGAFFYWTIVLEINPRDMNSYYSRAIVKEELYVWKSALKDYDKAIELAPDFVDAIINRGALKDEKGDFEGAIRDYDEAIKLSPNNGMVFYNRGNTKLTVGDKEGAYLDWCKAKELGSKFAEERITKEFKDKK